MATAFQSDAFQNDAFQVEVIIGAVWPDPKVVLYGVQYGPTGADYTGEMLLVLDVKRAELFLLLDKDSGMPL